MSVDYAGIAAEVAVAFAEVKQGEIILTRMVPGPSDPETPWIPGAPVPTTYTLDGIAKGVSEEFIDGSTILATDIEVTTGVVGTDENGVQASIALDLATDTLSIDGQVVAIIRDLSVPAAGTKVLLKFIVRA